MTSPLQIAVLDRGWVYVGRCTLVDGMLVIDGAFNIRRWGTEAGLGELAARGPQPNTRLDSAGTVRAPVSALVHLIDCDEDGWRKAPAEAA